MLPKKCLEYDPLTKERTLYKLKNVMQYCNNIPEHTVFSIFEQDFSPDSSFLLGKMSQHFTTFESRTRCIVLQTTQFFTSEGTTGINSQHDIVVIIIAIAIILMIIA